MFLHTLVHKETSLKIFIIVFKKDKKNIKENKMFFIELMFTLGHFFLTHCVLTVGHFNIRK